MHAYFGFGAAKAPSGCCSAGSSWGGPSFRTWAFPFPFGWPFACPFACFFALADSFGWAFACPFAWLFAVAFPFPLGWTSAAA